MDARTGEVVFITGGGSGIGAGLAKAFHGRGATVIIGGCDREALARVASAYPGMATQVLDVTDRHSVERAAREIAARYPALNVLINNAGIQRIVDFAGEGVDLATVGDEIDTNLKGLVYVTGAFLPLLRGQPSARLIHVGSGLGFVPLVRAPIYSATKAAVHAFTVALREQLRGSSVRVIELIPPIVETNLHRDQAEKPARAMPLDQFVARAMAALDAGREEAPVGLARVLRIGVRVAPTRFLGVVNRARTQKGARG